LKDDDDVKGLIMEVQIAKKLNGPSVVAVYGVVEREDGIYVMMEFCEKGDLKLWISIDGWKSSNAQLTELSLQAAKCLRTLETNKIVHRDIAARNFLLTSEMKVLLADFGMARNIKEGSYQYNAVNNNIPLPVKWCAPEVFKSMKFNAASDRYALGITIW